MDHFPGGCLYLFSRVSRSSPYQDPHGQTTLAAGRLMISASPFHQALLAVSRLHHNDTLLSKRALQLSRHYCICENISDPLISLKHFNIESVGKLAHTHTALSQIQPLILLAQLLYILVPSEISDSFGWSRKRKEPQWATTLKTMCPHFGKIVRGFIVIVQRGHD